MDLRPTKIGKVIVTDDDDLLRDLMVRALERENINVSEARNGCECLQQIQDVAPDLIVMDLEMPAVRGDTAIHIIRRNRALRALPIVVISGSGPEPSLESMGIPEHGYYLPKPFRLDQFIECVRTQLVVLDSSDLTEMLTGMETRDDGLSQIASAAAGKRWDVYPIARDGRNLRLLVPEELTRLDNSLMTDPRLQERVQVLAQVGTQWRKVWPRPVNVADKKQFLSL